MSDNDDNEDNDDQINSCEMRVKSVLLGDSGVGKTSIIRQFIDHVFSPNCQSSVSSSFSSRIIDIDISSTKKSINFDLWDTAGEEKYRSLAKIFYKDAKVIIFVYDITEKNSFESLKKFWYKEVISNCSSNTIFALVGNKIDLYDKENLKENEAKKWAKSINAGFYLTSAKSNQGIEILFKELGKKCLDEKYNSEEKDKKLKAKYENKKKNLKKKSNKDIDDDNSIKVDEPIIIKKEKHNKKKVNVVKYIFDKLRKLNQLNF